MTKHVNIVATYLAREARELCDACLAAELHLATEAVLRATFVLERLPGFRVRYSWCAGCRRRDRVIGIDRDEAPKASDSVPPAVPDRGARRRR